MAVLVAGAGFSASGTGGSASGADVNSSTASPSFVSRLRTCEVLLVFEERLDLLDSLGMRFSFLPIGLMLSHQLVEQGGIVLGGLG